MKSLIQILCVVAIVGFLNSCGDSHEKLVKDQMNYMDEITSIIIGVADGKVSSAEAAKEIKKWGKKGEDIKKRQQAFIDDNQADDFQKVAEKHSAELMKATENFMTALMKLQQSGRLTPEIQQAIENVKN